VLPFGLARLRPSAVRVRIESRSTSARPPRTASIKRPVLVPVSAHGSARERNCALASTMRLTMPNRSKVLRARRSIRVTATTSQRSASASSALPFVGGLMSVTWIGAISLFVLMEKTIPWGDWVSRLGGLLLVVWGVGNLVRIA